MQNQHESIEAVINFLNLNALSVTTVESCTAGLAAALMADVSGCGPALESGYIVYTEEAKHKCLGVSLEAMQTFGLTSEEVAKQMVIGALRKCTAKILVAITGTAESDDCLNGVVCFAFALKTAEGYRLLSETKSFEGERNQVRKAAALHAILSLPEIYEKIQHYPEIHN